MIFRIQFKENSTKYLLPENDLNQVKLLLGNEDFRI